MSAHQLITGVTWAVYVVLFATTAAEALRRPTRSHRAIALLFAAPTLVVVLALLASGGLLARGPRYAALLAASQLLMPYLSLRLARDFATVRLWVVRLALIGLLILGGASFLPGAQGLPWLFPLQLAYFVGLQLYSAVAFASESRGVVGITRRRLSLAAVGAALLGCAPLAVVLGGRSQLGLTIYEALNLAAGGCYFCAFAPPGRLRRSWQEPELRAFLGSTAGLTHLADEAAVLRALERGVADALGAPLAWIALCDEATGRLRGAGDDGPGRPPSGAPALAQAALDQQRALRSSEPAARRPGAPGDAPPRGVTLAAPLTAGRRRFGALIVHTPHEALFARDDLAVLELLAAHAAGVLEGRALIGDLASVQARAEATRLREDFLSAAAHDLKTPLTTILAQAQLLERRQGRRPDAPPDPRTVTLIRQSAERLRDLVATLLDAARAERGLLVGRRVNVDLVELAGKAIGPYTSDLHPCSVDGAGPILCHGDPERLGQLLGFLLDNAVKYSPDGGEVSITLRRQGAEALISVSDNGIGIDDGDLPYLFERFHRGANVDDRSFAGMGLSLAICRAIAEQHGGRIWAESRLGAGSTFTVALPLAAQGADDDSSELADHDRGR